MVLVFLFYLFFLILRLDKEQEKERDLFLRNVDEVTETLEGLGLSPWTSV